MGWRQFIMPLGTLDPERVEQALLDAGALSVTFSDASDNPVLEPGPGETPLWQDTLVTGLFQGDTGLDGLPAQLASSLSLASPPVARIEELPDRDWEREWLKDFRPMRFGDRLWICPTTHTVDEPGAAVVALDPGLAFGTGTHATTALCLEWLDGLDLDGCRVLDYGSGSGVLAIAALKLGATSATAMDIDPQAVVATRQNATANGVADALSVISTPDKIEGALDVVLANILAAPLVQFAEPITSTLGDEGMLALSGVLCEQAPDVMQAYAPWIRFDDPVSRQQDGQAWMRLTGRRR